jgi:hypothetical protein
MYITERELLPSQYSKSLNKLLIIIRYPYLCHKDQIALSHLGLKRSDARRPPHPFVNFIRTPSIALQ